jgi:hypothetical protein
MQTRQIPHHLLVLVLLVGVDGLCVLSEVIETRELFTAVAGEGAFARMFSVGMNRSANWTIGKAWFSADERRP